MTSSIVLPDIIRQLLTPSDLIILAIVLVNAIIGAYRGILRTLFGLFGKVAGCGLAAVAARLAAPLMARYLVMPIVGDVFEKQAAAAMATAASGSGPNFLQGLTDTLYRLVDSEVVQAAAQPLQTAAAEAAQRMAESLSYFLLFFIFLVMFSAIIRITGEAVRFLTHVTPLGALDSLAGAAIGALCGVILCVLILWALNQFAPAVFTELGVLSPNRVAQTAITRGILGVIAPA